MLLSLNLITDSTLQLIKTVLICEKRFSWSRFCLHPTSILEWDRVENSFYSVHRISWCQCYNKMWEAELTKLCEELTYILTGVTPRSTMLRQQLQICVLIFVLQVSYYLFTFLFRVSTTKPPSKCIFYLAAYSFPFSFCFTFFQRLINDKQAANKWQTNGRQMTNHRPTNDKPTAAKRQTNGWQMTNHWLTNDTPAADKPTADKWQNNGWQKTNQRLTIDTPTTDEWQTNFWQMTPAKKPPIMCGKRPQTQMYQITLIYHCCKRGLAIPHITTPMLMPMVLEGMFDIVR